MDNVYSLNHSVSYFQVDHLHHIRLSALFQLLQEAAIHHANQYQIGTGIMEDRGESWILNRVAMQLNRYPQYQESITIQTWATRLKHFKGFREFRVVSAGEIIAKASTLWLYIDLGNKTLTRLPAEIEARFPTRPNDLFFDKLDKLRMPRPGERAAETSISLRFTDMDGNQHVNNAAYMDFLQTGLHDRKLNTHPLGIQIQFAKEIDIDATAVGVKMETEEDSVRFSIGTSGEVAALGCLF